MLKAGIIGLGKMGISHAAIVGAHPSVDFIAVCDVSSLVLDAFKKYTKLNTYSDYIKMIDKEDLDFVVVATPTKFHYPIVKYALEKNKLVIAAPAISYLILMVAAIFISDIWDTAIWYNLSIILALAIQLVYYQYINKRKINTKLTFAESLSSR